MNLDVVHSLKGGGVKCIVDWLLRIVYEETLVSDIGRACLMEVRYKSRCWQDAIMFVISLVCGSW